MERDVYRRLSEIEDTHWWFAARRSVLGALLDRLAGARRDLRILEAGCGTGGNLKMLERYGRVSAFEPDAEARAIAEGKSGLSVSAGTLPEGIPFARDAFDIVVALDVMEHVEKDQAGLAALGKELAPGGRLIITVPAHGWMWSRHDEVHHHFRRYSYDELKTKLEKAGLRPITMTYFNSILFPLIAMVRLVGKALGRQGAGDDHLPSPLLNRILKVLFSSEGRLIGRVRLPVGVSLLAVAERPQVS
jgi:SAM-dependent methyltransferase